MAKRRVVAMVDPDPEWVSFVDKGAARKTFRVLKRADGGSELVSVEKDNIDNLAKHFGSAEHPFTACMAELASDYPDVERRKAICGAVKARIGKAAEGDAGGGLDIGGEAGDGEDGLGLRKSMIAALKARVGILRSLFDRIDPESPADDAAADETGGDDGVAGQGAAIIGAVFDRRVFESSDAVSTWLTEHDIQAVGDVTESDTAYRVACGTADTDSVIETQAFDTGVVLLVQKQAEQEVRLATSPDVTDAHVHMVSYLDEHQDGWTLGAGTPVHVHRIIGGIVKDCKWSADKGPSELDGNGVVLAAGYSSSHSGSIVSIAYEMTTPDNSTFKASKPAAERAGGQRMKDKVSGAVPATPGADETERTKGIGGGPASHVNFRAGIADVSTSPGIFQAFELMQRVLFNVLNDAEISEKAQHIADNLTEFNNFVLEQIDKFEPEAVIEEHKQQEALKAAPPPPPPPNAQGAPPAAQGQAQQPGEMQQLMSELVVLLREALGKTNAAPGAPATQAQKIDQIVELVESIATKFEGVGDRLETVEKVAIGRRGVSEVTETPEAKMARKRTAKDGVYDNLFPWGHTNPEAEEY